jgi:hypothetical protein
MLVNDKEIEVFDNDTEVTINERIAAEFDTIPEYLYKSSNEVVFLPIKAKETTDFDDYLKIWKEYFYNVNMIDAIKIWLIEHKNSIGDFDMIQYENTLENDYNSKFKINDFIRYPNQINEFINKINVKIQKNKKKTKNFIDIYKKLKKLKSIQHTPFKKERSEYKFITNIKDVSIQTVFANIRCTEDAPFSTFDNIYKVFKGFHPLSVEEWSISSKTSIIVKLFLNKEKYLDPRNRILSDLKDINYIDCVINFNDKGTLTLNLDIDYKVDVDIKKLRDIVEDIFMFEDFEIVNEIEEYLAGVVIYPNDFFNNYVMSDLIMNNNIFSEFLVVDESVKATKKKGGLHLRFFTSTPDEGICSIISRRLEGASKYIEDETLLNDLTVGSPYIRLRIKKVKNIVIVEKFINIFSKLLSLYKEKLDSVVNFYKQYIPKFDAEDEKEPVEHRTLTIKEIAPDLFGVSKYSRSCSHPPTIIKDSEVNEIEEKGIQVMKFPKSPEEGKQYNYICPDALNDEGKSKYIGLRINNLSNKDKYKYIPCCYEKDQFNKKNSDYNNYYEGKMKREIKQQGIYTSDKFTEVDKLSYLPKNLDKLFYSFDSNYTYMRKGVNNTPKSFLECVLYSTNPKFQKLNKEEKFKTIEDEFRKLLNYPYMCVASQENPGKSSEDIKQTLRKDGKIYMDPKRWIRLCETVYNCKIFIFSRLKGSKDAFLELPYHDKNYLSWREDLTIIPTVIIYEHWGVDSDQASTPLCELIVSDNEFNIGHYFKGNIPLKLDKIFAKNFKQYYFSTTGNKLIKIEKFQQKDIPSGNWTHQYIDSFGKTRMLFNSDGNAYTLSNPLPPLKLLEQNNYIGKVFTSDLQTYNNMKRTANLLVEYMILLFSRFMEIEKVSMETDNILEAIKVFVDNNIVINPKNNYIIPKKPSTDLEYIKEHNFVDINEKLIVDSMETLKRLIYCLRLRLNTKEIAVKEYHTFTEIENFYDNIIYYKTSSSEIVLKDLKLFQDIDTIIYNKVIPKKDKYFIKNKRILHDELCLLTKEPYGYTENDINNKNYKIYLYSSADNIKVKKNGKKIDKSFLAYKKKDKVYYYNIKSF